MDGRHRNTTIHKRRPHPTPPCYMRVHGRGEPDLDLTQCTKFAVIEWKRDGFREPNNNYFFCTGCWNKMRSMIDAKTAPEMFIKDDFYLL